MADRDAESKRENQPPEGGQSKTLDSVLTALMVVAGIGGLAGFATLFWAWWGHEITDPQEVLRIASQQYIDGNLAVAGDLAETVRFDTDPQSADEDSFADLPPESLEPSDQPAPLLSEAEKMAMDKLEEEKQGWIRVRDFLVGAGKFVRAQQTDEVRERRKRFGEAIKPLLAVSRAGFPPGREGEGASMLGESQLNLGDFRGAIDSFAFALDHNPTMARNLLPMLAEAKLRLNPASDNGAVSTIQKYLDISGLVPGERQQGQIIKLRALVQARRYDEVDAMVQRLKRDTPPSQQDDVAPSDFLDRVHLQDAIAQAARGIEQCESDPDSINENRGREEAVFGEALATLERLRREAGPSIALMARLWKARILCCLGDLDNGIAELTFVRQSRPLRAEGVVGGIEELEWLARRGEGRDFVQTARYLLREIGDDDGFDTRLISLAEFKRRLIDALGVLRSKKDFTNAIDAARVLPPLFDLATALTQEGLGFRQWAQSTIADGTDLSGEVSRASSKLARTRFRAAGDAFAQAAKEQFDTREYVPKLWSAIEAYQDGRHFRRSIALLRSYERYEERALIPRALIALGRALLAEGEIEQAIERFEHCIEQYPRDPSLYDARLLSARALIEKEEFDLGRQHLIENLQDQDLTPESPVWRDSLYTLGDMLFRRAAQNYLIADSTKDQQLKRDRLKDNQPAIEEAIRYLDQAVDRYFGKSSIQDPMVRAESAAYQASRARVMASRWPLIESASPEILESARRRLRNQGEEELNIALEGFARLRNHLNQLEEASRLSPKAGGILRNCYMSEAQTLQVMNRLEQAAAAYREVESRYANEPLVLEAIMARVSCVKQLGQHEKAKLLIKQANLVLGRIPTEFDDQFEKTTRFDRDGWKQYLGWVSQRVSANPPAQRR